MIEVWLLGKVVIDQGGADKDLAKKVRAAKK